MNFENKQFLIIILSIHEKTEAIKKLTINYDHNKLLINQGTKRLCENCYSMRLATLIVNIVFKK